MSTVTTKFDVGDTVYIAIHPTLDILQCIVDYIRITPISDTNFSITYRLHRTVNLPNGPTSLDYIKESEVYTFAEAKAELLSWLTDQTIKVTAMTEPI